MRTDLLPGAAALAITCSIPIAAGASDPQPVVAPRTRVAANGPTSKPAPIDLGPRVIHRAIVDSLDPADDLAPVGRATFGSAAPTAQQRIDRPFQDAQAPTCFTSDALKFEPPTWGPIALNGLFVLPFWMHAIATGRCRH